MSSLYELIELPRIPDRRGSLTFIEGGGIEGGGTEGGGHVPFDIARVYYLYDVPASANRAGHAHHRLVQLLIAVAGSFDVNLDNGAEKATVHLDRPYLGLLLRPMVWRTIDNFSGGAICLVLASIPYDEDEYIRDYAAFCRLCRAAE